MSGVSGWSSVRQIAPNGKWPCDVLYISNHDTKQISSHCVKLSDIQKLYKAGHHVRFTRKCGC